MKFNLKAGLGFGLYVGFVYAVGSYLGYRLGKSAGRFEAETEHMIEEIERMDKELKEKYPVLFKEEEA